MLAGQIFLYAINSKVWSGNSAQSTSTLFRQAVTDAVTIERQILKGVNLAEQRERYAQCCEIIEGFATEAVRAGRTEECLHLTTLDSTYHALLAKLLSDEKTCEMAESARLGKTFFSPEDIAEHVNQFAELTKLLNLEHLQVVKDRIKFFKQAAAKECGVIEYPEMVASGGPSVAWQSHLTAFDQSHTVAVTEDARKTSYEQEKTPSPIMPTGLKQILRAEIEEALKTGGGVNFRNFPHNIITEVLNEFVYVDSKKQNPVYINILYADGSEGPSFPLLCLTRPTQVEINAAESMPAIKMSLISMRHLAMDRDIDMAFFRNRDVSRTRRLAETDLFCTKSAKRDLVAGAGTGIAIQLYQTGFQPAVVGFYRALVEVILKIKKQTNSNLLAVLPHYFQARDASYYKGSWWI